MASQGGVIPKTRVFTSGARDLPLLGCRPGSHFFGHVAPRKEDAGKRTTLSGNQPAGSAAAGANAP